MAINEKSTVVDLVEGLPRLRVYDEEISAFEDKQFVSTLPLAEKNTYIGIEVETENIHTWHSDYAPYWKMTEDGSLRNNGREFVSVPIKAFRVENALTTLFNNQLNKDIEFTDRTSIHIHMNVRTMTLEQLKTMVLLYLVFEKAMFRYVNPDRYENIFCVPLNETSFGENLHILFHSDRLAINWSKYTALNLCPIFEKGTIEFRHLHGTKDVKEIVNWVNLILCLKKAALKNTSEYLWDKVKTLNTSSQYHEFANEIFGSFIIHLDDSKLIKDMASCVTYVKTRCFQNFWKTDLTLSITKENPLYKFTTYARTGNNSILWGLPPTPRSRDEEEDWPMPEDEDGHEEAFNNATSTLRVNINPTIRRNPSPFTIRTGATANITRTSENLGVDLTSESLRELVNSFADIQPPVAVRPTATLRNNF